MLHSIEVSWRGRGATPPEVRPRRPAKLTARLQDGQRRRRDCPNKTQPIGPQKGPGRRWLKRVHSASGLHAHGNSKCPGPEGPMTPQTTARAPKEGPNVIVQHGHA
eukprot:9494815-Pyramimonas_sp.AAC.2